MTNRDAYSNQAGMPTWQQINDPGKADEDVARFSADSALVDWAGNVLYDRKLYQLFGDDIMIVGTFANRPLATSVAVGKEFMATDLGNMRWVTDGAKWITLKPCQIVGNPTQASIVDSVGQSTTESTFLTLNLPANCLSATDGLLLDLLWACTNTAAAKRIRGRFGGTVLFNVDLTTHLVFRQSIKLRNRNSLGAQISQANSVTSFGPIGSVGAQTFTVDFSVAQVLTLTGQFPVEGSGANTLSLEEATINAI